MKRTTIFLLTVLWIAAVLAGCGAPSEEEQAVEKIRSANVIDVLLEQYENLTLSYELADGTNFYKFMDAQTYLSTDDTHTATILFTAQEQCETGIVDGAAYFDRYINPFHMDLGAAWRKSALMEQMSPKEKVTSFVEENGVLYVETTLKEADLSQSEMEYISIPLETGDQYICEYEVDAQTYRVLTLQEYILREDGTRENLGRFTTAVNVERPAYIAELEAKGKAIDAMPAEAVRVITCIVDPGLETEYVVSQTVEKGNYVLFSEDLLGYGLYMDAEGTRPFVSTPDEAADSNFTVYLIKK